MNAAMFWKNESAVAVRCSLCHQHCLIMPGTRGICGVRENRDGALVTLVYGRPVSLAVDPIEKKPLYHVLPGSKAFSLGTVGCNFRCLNCQNCSISQLASDGAITGYEGGAPDTVVATAKAKGCASIAYTYNEPTIFYEYAYDIARLARQAGLKNLFITNGYITPEALQTIAPYLDAANIDLKFFTDECYREVAGARLQPVLDMIRLYHKLGIWIEITTLVIPGYNDDARQLGGMAAFIAGIDPGIPWHLSAFFPTYKLTDAPPTPLAALEKARTIGHNAGLKHVYLGNVRESANTECPSCGAVLVERTGARVLMHGIADGCCPSCNTRVGGIWS